MADLAKVLQGLGITLSGVGGALTEHEKRKKEDEERKQRMAYIEALVESSKASAEATRVATEAAATARQENAATRASELVENPAELLGAEAKSVTTPTNIMTEGRPGGDVPVEAAQFTPQGRVQEELTGTTPEIAQSVQGVVDAGGGAGAIQDLSTALTTIKGEVKRGLVQRKRALEDLREDTIVRNRAEFEASMGGSIEAPMPEEDITIGIGEYYKYMKDMRGLEQDQLKVAIQAAQESILSSQATRARMGAEDAPLVKSIYDKMWGQVAMMGDNISKVGTMDANGMMVPTPPPQAMIAAASALMSTARTPAEKAAYMEIGMRLAASKARLQQIAGMPDFMAEAQPGILERVRGGIGVGQPGPLSGPLNRLLNR